MSVFDCRLLPLPKIPDRRGNLTFVESQRHAPFDVQRAYTIYNVPSGERRGGHAYRTMHELIIALSGSFDVVVADGRDLLRFPLNRPYYSLHIPPMIWRDIENFSTNGVALILASAHYDEDEYIRDYAAFQEASRRGAPL